MKHTPGRWEVGHFDKCTVWTENDFRTQRLQIANCKYLDQEFGEDIREETRATAEANARLIAAAPQLLGACEGLLSALPIEDVIPRTYVEACIKDAQAAIAATTETQ